MMNSLRIPTAAWKSFQAYMTQDEKTSKDKGFYVRKTNVSAVQKM